MTFRTLLLVGVLQFTVTGYGYAQCAHTTIEPCLLLAATQRLEALPENELKQHSKLIAQLNTFVVANKQNKSISALQYRVTHLKAQIDAAAIAPSQAPKASSALLKPYHDALLKVLPQQSAQLKKQLLNDIAQQDVAYQAHSFYQLALIEFFTGRFPEAKSTLKHALLLAPTNNKLVILEHFMNRAEPLLDYAINEIGFTHGICGSPQQESGASLKTVLSEPVQQLDQYIGSLPDSALKLQSYYLLSSYLKTLNRCQFLYRYFDYRVLQTLNKQDDNERFFSLVTLLLEDL